MGTSQISAHGAVYADLRTDFMFKKAFGQKDIMIPFLNDILETVGYILENYYLRTQMGPVQRTNFTKLFLLRIDF